MLLCSFRAIAQSGSLLNPFWLWQTKEVSVATGCTIIFFRLVVLVLLNQFGKDYEELITFVSKYNEH